MPSSPRSRRLLGLGVCGVPIGVAPSVWPAASLHINSRSPETSLCGVIEGCDELGELLIGNAAQLADLDAAQLAGPQEVVDLVPADVQHLRYLLDGVCLQRLSHLLPVVGRSWAAPLFGHSE